MTEYRVRMFARLRELAGADVVAVRVAEPATVAALRAALMAALPNAATLLPHCVFAAGNDLAEDADAISPGAELACLPPVSGG